MKKTVLKDFNSILQLCQGNPPQQAIDLILNCKQTNEYGCMLTSNDELTGHHVMYSVHFIFDSEENRASIDNSYYDKLSALQKQQLSNCLAKVLLRSRDFERSKGFTSFSTVTPLAIDIENVIGAIVFMTTSGGDNNAPIKTYQFIDTDSQISLCGE